MVFRKELRSKWFTCDVTFRNERSIFLLFVLLFSGQNRLQWAHTLKLRAEVCEIKHPCPPSPPQITTTSTTYTEETRNARQPPNLGLKFPLFSWALQGAHTRCCSSWDFRYIGPVPPCQSVLLYFLDLQWTKLPLPCSETGRELTLSERSAPARPASLAHTWACLYRVQTITPRIFSFPNQGQSLPTGRGYWVKEKFWRSHSAGKKVGFQPEWRMGWWGVWLRPCTWSSIPSEDTLLKWRQI